MKIFWREGGRPVLGLSDPTHGRNRKVRDSKYHKERALLNEPRRIERGSVALMMKAVAAGLDSRVSSHSPPQLLCLPAALSHSSQSWNLCLGHFCKMHWWETGFLWLCLSGWGTGFVLWQAAQMRNYVSKSCSGQVRWVVWSPPYS